MNDCARCLYAELLRVGLFSEKTELRHSVGPTKTELAATSRLLEGSE